MLKAKSLVKCVNSNSINFGMITSSFFSFLVYRFLWPLAKPTEVMIQK